MFGAGPVSRNPNQQGGQGAALGRVLASPPLSFEVTSLWVVELLRSFVRGVGVVLGTKVVLNA